MSVPHEIIRNLTSSPLTIPVLFGPWAMAARWDLQDILSASFALQQPVTREALAVTRGGVWRFVPLVRRGRIRNYQAVNGGRFLFIHALSCKRFAHFCCVEDTRILSNPFSSGLSRLFSLSLCAPEPVGHGCAVGAKSPNREGVLFGIFLRSHFHDLSLD